MTPSEAKKHLKSISYIPGKSKTLGMEPDVRTKTKQALNALKADGSLWAFADEMTAKQPAASGQ